MPVLRGTVHHLHAPGGTTSRAVVISNDRWNAVMSQIAVLPVVQSLRPGERPYAVPYDGHFVTTARPLAILAPPHPGSPVGPAIAGLSSVELDAVEERLAEFLQLPALLRGVGAIARPTGDTAAYPLWGEVYRGPVLGGERKRFVVVSPSDWNRESGLAVGVRTTTQLKIDDLWFPPILGGTSRACCGDASTFPLREWRLHRRDRPVPFTATAGDMAAIARGLADVYELDGAG
ncbi:MAG TPA: hypothetical protein VIN34_06270 [Candidatus Limnocylindria bacterium]